MAEFEGANDLSGGEWVRDGLIMRWVPYDPRDDAGRRQRLSEAVAVVEAAAITIQDYFGPKECSWTDAWRLACKLLPMRVPPA